MISFRFHLVSLTAIFLALALGVMMGVTVIDRGVVDRLNSRVDAVDRRAASAEEENGRLSEELRRWDQLAAEVGPSILRDRLLDVPVLVIAVRGIDTRPVDDARAALEAAGASLQGTLWFTNRWSLRDQEDVARLAEAADSLTDTSVELVRTAAITGTAEALGRRDDLGVVGRLVDAGFVELDAAPGSPSTLESLPEGVRFLLISDAEPDVPNEDLLRPLAAELGLETPGGIVVAEAAVDKSDGSRSRAEVVGPLREDGNVSSLLSTIDHLETFAGRVAVVAALADLGAERRGHYGVGEGAARLVPEQRA